METLKTYATLSPIPGFAEWLSEQTAERGDDLLQAAELRILSSVLPGYGTASALAALTEHENWHQDDKLAGAVESPLLRLCAVYLTTARRGKYARDRVAHFHLSNGARMERINWLADTSSVALRQSLGIMVNYRYDSGEIEDNHEAYRGHGRIKTSGKIKALLRSKG